MGWINVQVVYNTVMKAEIISVGTELLVGSTLDTNSRFLSQKLAETSLDVYHRATVGDNVERIVSALELAASRSDLIITSGGLGPTEDDVTARSLARFLGRDMIYHRPTAKFIESRFKMRSLRINRLTLRQCYVPKDAVIFPNLKGTAPGILCRQRVRGRDLTVLLLPGPPRELEPMFMKDALPYLIRTLKIQKGHFVTRAVRIAGLLETQVARRVGPLLKMRPPTTVGIYAKPGEVELKIMAKAASASIAVKAADRIERLIRKKFGRHVYGTDSDTLAGAVGALLNRRHANLATAESCTGGLISHMITQVPGSSKYFLGGVLAYDNGVKTGLLAVSENTLSLKGAVSPEVARQMAAGARRKFKADYAIASTGIAGPGGGTRHKPVGRVYIAIAGPKSIFVKGFIFLGTRAEVKFSAAQQALNLLRMKLL